MTCITCQLRQVYGPAVDELGAADRASYDLFWNLLPGGGQLHPMAFLVMTMPSPLLGQPGLVTYEALPSLTVTRAEALTQAGRLLGVLRAEARSRLAAANGKSPQ